MNMYINQNHLQRAYSIQNKN